MRNRWKCEQYKKIPRDIRRLPERGVKEVSPTQSALQQVPTHCNQVRWGDRAFTALRALCTGDWTIKPPRGQMGGKHVTDILGKGIT